MSPPTRWPYLLGLGLLLPGAAQLASNRPTGLLFATSAVITWTRLEDFGPAAATAIPLLGLIEHLTWTYTRRPRS